MTWKVILLAAALPAASLAQTTAELSALPASTLASAASQLSALADLDRLVPLGILQAVYGKVVDNVQRQFLGIQYAKAGRWEAPRPLSLLERIGVKNATVFGSPCKFKHPSTALTDPYAALWSVSDNTAAESEDCLTLNIWAPRRSAIPSGTLLPVMVNIHGGSYETGSSGLALNNMASFQKTSPTPIVVVNLNYRLGVLGFGATYDLATEDANSRNSAGSAFGYRGTAGNYGILDQVQALRWIKENIAKFGGDPNKVTVFGESAGSMSINTLQTLAVVGNEKLFHRAILQSGGITTLAPTALASRDYRFKYLASNVGCGEAALASSKKTLLQCMRSVPVDTLLAAEIEGGWSPTLDGVALQLNAAGYNNGTLYRVPALVGWCAQDGSIFTGIILAKTLAGLVPTEEDYVTYVSGLNLFGTPGTANFNYAVGNITQLIYPSSLYGGDVGKTAVEGLTDIAFRCPSVLYAITNNVATNGANPVYVYELDHVLTAVAAAAPGLAAFVGTYHTSDISWINNLLNPAALTPLEVTLQKEMQGAWVRFAATGNPNETPSAPTWVPSSTNSKIVFSTPSRLYDPIITPDRLARCQAFARYVV